MKKSILNVEVLTEKMKEALNEISIHRDDLNYVKKVLRSYGIVEFLPQKYREKLELDKRSVYGFWRILQQSQTILNIFN